MGMLSRLQVWDFRNLRCLDLAPAQGVTVLLGNNGQGKSNVLEAICYLGWLRSFRTQSTADLRRWGAESFTVRGEVQDPDPLRRVTLAVTQGERRYLQVNSAPVERASDFINRFLCIPLVPEDLEMVKGTASVRRRFLNSTMSQRWPAYLAELQRYRAAVGSRNQILRTPHHYPPSVLSAYEDLIVRHGGQIEFLRRQHVADLGRVLAELSGRLMGAENLTLAVSYVCPGLPREPPADSAEVLSAGLAQALQRNRERDSREGHTSVGPHRADLTITLAGRSLGTCGSEGECRLASLALRLASLTMAQEAAGAGKAVVALVDDVIGELDATRRRAFFAVVCRADQVIVAATATPPELARQTAAIYRVQEGVVAPA
jgi:DNA replication and repair protein RecF